MTRLVASIATGKIDAVVFIGGFLLGSLVFGDFFPTLTFFGYAPELPYYIVPR